MYNFLQFYYNNLIIVAITYHFSEYVIGSTRITENKAQIQAGCDKLSRYDKILKTDICLSYETCINMCVLHQNIL